MNTQQNTTHMLASGAPIVLPGYAPDPAPERPVTLPVAELPRAIVADTPPPGTIQPQVFEDSVNDRLQEKRELERQLAFQARPFTWRGQQLAAFAIDREGDWLLHRALIGAPPLPIVFGQGSAFTLDACRILWFLSHDPREWQQPSRDLQAQVDDIERTPQELAWDLEHRIRAWAVEHIPDGSQTEAVTLAFAIFNRAHTTRATVKPDRPENEERSGN
jgi:hypothetical protein